MRARALALFSALLLAPRGSQADAEGSSAPPRRIHSRGKTTWIWAKPRRGGQPLGYLRAGDSVRLRSAERQSGAGCAGGWYAVEPRGYVCVDRTATLDASERSVRVQRLMRGRDALLPFSYALSNGAPMYRRLPTPEEWGQKERWLGPAGSFRPQSWGNRGHERLAEQRAIAADSQLPWFLQNGGSSFDDGARDVLARLIPHGSMLSYTRAFEQHGRTFLLSADGTLVPADRVRPYRESKFRGIELGGTLDLPLAFIREKPRPRWRRNADGSFVPAEGQWALRSAVPIAPGSAAAEHARRRYLQTTLSAPDRTPLYILEDDATVVTRRDGAAFGAKPTEKWILVSITQGTLVAYDAGRPVYATLISPGAGGVPMAGRDPVKWSTTPLGTFRVTFKHRAATMSPEPVEDKRTFWIADVPWTQYFQAPFALHTAYWHEDFGQPMSAGCVNLSPYDGRWLFEFTDPKLPEGWNGVAAGRENGPGTRIVIVR